ncbi:uncharacterized protein LOC105182881 isoform X2 [Harpegnathos saltator]|uniref:uncharacterized protein LOC105182881 isoform X2 n=1 Tax=Harpegnathos saltator TaxID=610380 RepID=UPI00058B2F90|nr:uncharacterized protein LOC105182881 isoform X2 [Harpegnathos saltator]
MIGEDGGISSNRTNERLANIPNTMAYDDDDDDDDDNNDDDDDDGSVCVRVADTPHISSVVDSSGRSCHDSVDSGYLSNLTPHSSYTPMVSTGYKNKLSAAVAKRHRYRSDPWQCEKFHRRRSKPSSQLVNSSESSEQDSGRLELSRASEDLGLLAHSTPSYTNNDVGNRTLGSRTRRKCKIAAAATAAAPVTPALSAGLHLLSPPPSPAMPTSSFRVTSGLRVDEDARMRLVVPPRESIPEVATLMKTPIPLIVVSPVRKRIDPATITSVENRQLSNLSIVDLSAIPEIKPKRLDFSHRGGGGGGGGGGLTSELRHSGDTEVRTIPPAVSYARKDKVDFLSLLGKESNHWNLVSKILSYLGCQDLCTVSMVSTTWRRICRNDTCANRRRMHYILRKQNVKENFTIAKKVKHEEDIQMSPKSRKGCSDVRKGCLSNVQNVLHVPLQQSRPPNSPPVSPSKVKFHSYVKASRTLAHGEYLLPCPKCTFPSHVDSEKNMGTCTRQGCSIEFCISCSSRPHIGPCMTPLLATPTKRNKRLIVGSRQSKRNLRRL